jgi:hypothetical protein
MLEKSKTKFTMKNSFELLYSSCPLLICDHALGVNHPRERRYLNVTRRFWKKDA